MARVRTGVGRYAMVESLYECLHIVVPAGGIGRTFHPGDEHGAQVVVLQKLLLLVGEAAGRHPALLIRLAVVVGGRETVARTHRDDLMGTVEHQSGNLLHRQLRRQIGSPLTAWQTPVLISIERVVAVEVLKGISSVGKQFDTRLRGVAQRGAALLFHDDEGAHLSLRPFLSSA